MTTALHDERPTVRCPDAQGYAVTPHPPHVWHDEDGQGHECEGCR